MELFLYFHFLKRVKTIRKHIKGKVQLQIFYNIKKGFKICINLNMENLNEDIKLVVGIDFHCFWTFINRVQSVTKIAWARQF